MIRKMLCLALLLTVLCSFALAEDAAEPVDPRIQPAIALSFDDGPSEYTQQVLDILAQTPGSICVMLYLSDEKKTYQAPREYWVDEGYDFGALANLIGADGIVLKG